MSVTSAIDPVSTPAGEPTAAGSAAPPPVVDSTPIATGTPVTPVAGAAAMPGAPDPVASPGPMAAPSAGASGAAAMPVATAGSAALAGSGAGSGAAGMLAAAGGMPALEPGGLQCPNEVCAPLPALPPEAATFGFSVELCCADGGDCGTALNGAACVRTGDSVPECPALAAMGFMVPSCCTPMGQCGVDGSAFMRGCMALEDIAAMAGAFIEVPDPKPCTPAG